MIGDKRDNPDATAPPAEVEWLDSGRAIISPEGEIHRANESLCRWLGLTIPLPGGVNFWECLGAMDHRWRDVRDRLRAGKEIFAEAVVEHPAREGLPSRWYQLELTRTDSHYVVRVHSMLPSLAALEESAWNEHLQSEAAQCDMFVRLLRAESRLQNITEQWPGIIFSQRADFTFRFVSPKIEDLTGCSISDWQRDPGLFWRLIHEADSEELRQHIQAGREQPGGSDFTFRIKNPKSGRVVYVREHRVGIRSRNGLLLGYEGVWLDVTRQVIAEKRLINTAWKETLAVLTMGLAHDFSNVMAGIHSLSESFLCGLEAEHPFREGLNLIMQNSLQANQLVQRILSLHQGKTGECNYHDLNEIARDVEELVRKILPRRLELVSQYASTSLPVYVDAVEFRQVIINLALNALDAMPGSGRLRITTGFHDRMPETGVALGTPPRLPCVSLTLEDTGCGIPARVLGKVFDPFYTSKPMNKGSGLGLYNTRLFAERHYGLVSVRSSEGTGTAFTLWLPQADFTEAERASESSNTANQPENRASLLVLGASGENLTGTAEFLRSNNFHVVEAVTPENAEACLRDELYQFAGMLVLLDSESPDFKPCLPELHRLNPAMKMILKPLGCDRDALETETLPQVDLVISPDASCVQILSDLHDVLQASQPES